MNKKDKKLAILGLGYVGLPLAIAFSNKGYKVVAYDNNENRISQLTRGIDVTSETIREDLKHQNLFFTSQEEHLKEASIYIITVPTPISDVNRPNLSMLLSATKTVGKYLKKNDIVIYESTVYPGVTEDDCVPILEEASGLSYIVDFGVGYSPERINPGDKHHRLESIIKVVSASDESSLAIISALYKDIIKAGVFECPNIKTAEAAKVIENIQRDLNVALMNELAIIFHKLKINTHEVLDAASTKWNFARYEPGLVGGHCIGVDPYYLTHCAEKFGYTPQVILSGRKINNHMGEYIANEVMKNLLRKSTTTKIPFVITVMGFTFKENVPDIRNTKVIDIVRALESFGAHVQVHDPYITEDLIQKEYKINSLPLENLLPADGVILAVKHNSFIEEGWPLVKSLLKEGKGFVADLKNSLSREKIPPHINLWSL